MRFLFGALPEVQCGFQKQSYIILLLRPVLDEVQISAAFGLGKLPSTERVCYPAF